MMKTSKSPENAEVTPSKKKLKQARLPFKPKSDVLPAPVVPHTRKRKISASGDESLTKIGKICKENFVSEDPVIISDDDSKPIEKDKNDEQAPNPYVKLVNAAWKKKQKAKKRNSRTKVSKVPNGSVDTEHESPSDLKDDKESDCEMMDVDDDVKEVGDSKDSKQIHQEINKPNSTEDVNGIVVLEDSNNSTDVRTKETADNTNVSENKDKTDSVILKSPEKNDEHIIIQNIDESDCPSSQDNLESPKENDIDDQDLSKKSVVESSPANTPVTPKRSARNKAKAEQNNNMNSSPSTKLNESLTSNPTTPKTPKNRRSSSVTTSQGDVSLNESTMSASLTPKQVQKKLESAKKKEEREKEKQEREKKKQQEKEEKAKIRQEKEEQRKKEKEEKEGAKKKEKEEKEEQRRKEKEEKEKLKEIEKKQREEKEEQKKKEREEKEEQKKKEKEAKEEEKRKKQEALELEKQEAELKKKKAAEALSKFLVPKQKSDKDQATINSVSNSMLSNFTIKADMRLASLNRAKLDSDKRQELDNSLKKQDVLKSSLYLNCLKDGTSKPLGSGKTWPLSDKDDDVMIVEDELPSIYSAGVILSCQPASENLRPKLLSFHDNRRPPYWGTFRKRSPYVKPRRPFGRDKKHVDYEVDSDEEWEEEQEGESIDGSAAGSDDEQDPDEYEVDNDVFVPHGYLSDEEATMDEDDVLSLSPETQKARLKHLEDEFESEMRKPTEKLQPRMYGLLWETVDGGKPDNCVDALWNYFGKLSMIMNDPTPLLQPPNEPDETEKKKVKKKKVEGEQKSPKVDKKKTPKTEDKEGKLSKVEAKKNASEAKKNQPGINKFLTKLKSS